jgi:hypothetical protein|tara:strand:- start:3563 stop:4117 length:555 start_codon:yes stop_codon:yes gene_type:complete
MDIDIDFADRQDALAVFKNTSAKLKKGKHNTGVYFHRVPTDPFTGLCTVEHTKADEAGFFKLDILNVSIYKEVKDNNHLNKLMEKEPIWQLLEHDEFNKNVFHLSGHGELLRQLKPSSVEQLAATLAIIRPAKRHLQTQTWSHIMDNVWTKPQDGSYYFKKAHAISYAMAVIVHINLICEELGY